MLLSPRVLQEAGGPGERQARSPWKGQTSLKRSKSFQVLLVHYLWLHASWFINIPLKSKEGKIRWFLVHGYMVWIREYRMTYRGPGFFAVVVLVSSSTPFPPLPSASPPVCRRSRLLTGEGGGGGRWAKSYEKAWPSINHSRLSGTTPHWEWTVVQKIWVAQRRVPGLVLSRLTNHVAMPYPNCCTTSPQPLATTKLRVALLVGFSGLIRSFPWGYLSRLFFWGGGEGILGFFLHLGWHYFGALPGIHMTKIHLLRTKPYSFFGAQASPLL